MSATTTTTTESITVLSNIQDPNDTKNVYYQSGGYRLSRPVLEGADAKKTFDSIPTVDVSNIFSPDLEVRKAIAAEVGKVCEEVGFFYAANPPVSKEKMGKHLRWMTHEENEKQKEKKKKKKEDKRTSPLTPLQRLPWTSSRPSSACRRRSS